MQWVPYFGRTTSYLRNTEPEIFMAMNEMSSNSLRAGARFFGVLFQVLAFLALAGTLVTSIIVARLGQRAGFNGSHDPLVWIILASGLFATFVLAGFGYALGMLCAIFDRQEWTRPARQLPPRGSAPAQLPTPSSTPTAIPPSQPSVAIPTPAENAQSVQTSPTAASTTPADRNGQDAKSKNWLTRERHLKKPK